MGKPISKGASRDFPENLVEKENKRYN